MGISRDQVVWVYRILLRREPESEDLIAQIMESYHSRLDLIFAVMESDEFNADNCGQAHVAHDEPS